MKKNLCRNKKMCMFGVSLLILTLIVAAILGLLAGPTSPITWILIAILVVIPFIHKKMAQNAIRSIEAFFWVKLSKLLSIFLHNIISEKPESKNSVFK